MNISSKLEPLLNLPFCGVGKFSPIITDDQSSWIEEPHLWVLSSWNPLVWRQSHLRSSGGGGFFFCFQTKRRQLYEAGETPRTTGALFLALDQNVYFSSVRIHINQCLAFRAPDLRMSLQIHQSSIASRAAHLFKNNHITPPSRHSTCNNGAALAGCYLWDRFYRAGIYTPYSADHPRL